MDMDSATNFTSDEQNEEEEKHLFHVLAVDDSNIDRKLLERLLTFSSYQGWFPSLSLSLSLSKEYYYAVTCVESGDKALEYLGLVDIHEEHQEHEYEISSSPSSSPPSTTISPQSSLSKSEVSKVNLIMTDYSMPGITGYDLLKRIKDSTWKDVPVVVMSSENVPSRINMCLEGGAEEFLLKPVKLSDLRKLHSQLINSTNTPCEESVTCEIESAICEIESANATDEEDGETDKNCTNANKRKGALAAPPSELSERWPRVQELPVS